MVTRDGRTATTTPRSTVKKIQPWDQGFDAALEFLMQPLCLTSGSSLIDERLKRLAVVDRPHVDNLAVLHLEIVDADYLPGAAVRARRISNRHACRDDRFDAPNHDGS